MLTAWIEGPVLASGAVTLEHARHAGAILRAIHDTTPPDVGEAVTDDAPDAWGTVLERKIARLHAARMLSASEVDATTAVAHRGAPALAHIGVVHGDVCPENLVVDPHGRLWLVDNDSLTVRAMEYDLARIWYRWPMTRAGCEAFVDGYGDSAALAAYHQHVVHWAVVVLVGAAEFRIRYSLPGAEDALHRLRDIVANQTGSRHA